MDLSAFLQSLSSCAWAGIPVLLGVGWYGSGVSLHDHTDAVNGGVLGVNSVNTTQLVNAAVTQAKLSSGSVGQAQLRTSTGSASITGGAGADVAMNDYAYNAMIGGEPASTVTAASTDLGTTVAQIGVVNGGASTCVVRWRFGTA